MIVLVLVIRLGLFENDTVQPFAERKPRSAGGIFCGLADFRLDAFDAPGDAWLHGTLTFLYTRHYGRHCSVPKVNCFGKYSVKSHPKREFSLIALSELAA